MDGLGGTETHWSPLTWYDYHCTLLLLILKCLNRLLIYIYISELAASFSFFPLSLFDEQKFRRREGYPSQGQNSDSGESKFEELNFVDSGELLVCLSFHFL